MIRSFGFWILAAFGLFMAVNVSAQAGDQAPRSEAGKLLQQAWEEYGFQNWEKSEAIFQKAAKAADITERQKIQTRIGLAFIQEYRAPGQRPDQALESWKSILKDIGDNDELSPFCLMHMAYAYVITDKPDYETSRQTYRQALALIKNKQSDLGQQTILNLLSTHLMRFNAEDIKAGLAASAELLPLIKGCQYESAGHLLAAQMALAVNDTDRLYEEVLAQYNAGINTRSLKETALLRLECVSEIHRKNYQEAAKYYDLLAKEVPTSGRAYYARMRAAELRQGVIESKLFEPGGVIEKDLALDEALTPPATGAAPAQPAQPAGQSVPATPENR